MIVYSDISMNYILKVNILVLEDGNFRI